jgi:hypothetical protein
VVKDLHHQNKWDKEVVMEANFDSRTVDITFPADDVPLTVPFENIVAMKMAKQAIVMRKVREEHNSKAKKGQC